jgi:unsaturated rhamnogalacturonyl hydrolase
MKTMILEIFLTIIIFFFFLIFFIDIVPILSDWTSRFHIGRYDDVLIWKNAIIHKGLRWLLNTPKIKVSDNTRLIVIDMLKGNYSKSTIQYWQEGSLLLGLNEHLKLKEDESVKKEIVNFLDSKFNSGGDWINKPDHIDSALLSYSVMKLDLIDKKKYKKSFDYTWDLIKEHIGKEGTVEYRKSMKMYRYVDTIGFICPFLVAYGIEYNKNECIELAIKQINEYVEYGMLDYHFIPCHTYEVGKKTPQGLYGWGRGLGWFAIGLIDAWNELPNNHKYKLKLEEIIKKFARATIEFQQEDGSWNWTVTRNECRPDSSTTATLAWFLLNAANISEISKQCLDGTEKAIKFLMSVTRRNGAVDFSQGDTKDIGVYSLNFNILPFTQGFCIRVISLYRNMINMQHNEYHEVNSVM